MYVLHGYYLCTFKTDIIVVIHCVLCNMHTRASVKIYIYSCWNGLEYTLQLSSIRTPKLECKCY